MKEELDGKQTAINYVAYKLNYTIINFIITQSTKIEDLLGRNQIIRKDGQIKVEFCETKILKALIGKEESQKGNNIIIVFHNLNKASSALMESLCSIFNKKQTNILRPDGKSVVKSKINLIGIINSQSNIAIKDKLPLSLINCVFYYILPKLSAKEIKEIIFKKFRAFNLLNEAEDFANCFNKSREFSYTKGNISYFSLNDITKYILFRRYTKNYLDKYIILQIIFAYRFIQNEFIKDIMNELGFLSLKANPIIKNKDDYLSISFKNKDIKNEIKLPYYDKINKLEIQQNLNTLNIKQKQCILFLALSVLCKRACIIQGDTASGKTHLIRLFAEMLGQKLIVYQINKETGLSIFSGQSVLLNHLEEEEIFTIVKYFEILSQKEIFQKYLNNYFFFDNYNSEIIEKKWKVKQFNNLIQKIREYIEANNANMEIDEYKQFKKIAYDLEELIQPYKRFKKNESMFLKALENGYWVLIDGIESANPVISDKLVRLCNENAELDLTETGENIIFSNNSLNNRIHPNFHLFINYNPLNKSNTNQLSEMFLNKCLTFTLAPMDFDIESSAQILYGYMKNSNYIDEILCQEISSKVALIHQEMNKKIHENQDFFSGGVEFTGRIIKYIGEEIYKSKNENDLYKHLVNAFYLNYIYSINNKNNIRNIIEVKNIIKTNLKKTFNFDTGEKDIFIKYSDIFKILRNIQKVCKKIIKEYDFNFFHLLKLLKKVEINDFKIINYHINQTLKILDEFVGNSLKNKLKYFHYYYLEIIQRLIKNILDYIDKNKNSNIMDFCLNDEEELISKSILIKEISEFNLVFRLESEIKQFKLTESFIYIPEEILLYIDSINKLMKSCDCKYLYDNLKIINKIINDEINISQLFPFNQILLEKKENNGKKIRMFKIIYLIYKIIENKVNFQFSCNSDIIKFNFKKEDLEPFNNLYIIINITKDFYFENSQILTKNEIEEKRIVNTMKNIDEIDINNTSNWFYIICTKILDNKIQVTDKIKLYDIIEDVSEKNIRILDELTEEFEREIKEDKRTYRLTKLISKNKEVADINEDDLIMKIWFLVLFYDEKKLELITPFFCLSFEKELLNGIKNLYKNLNINIISKIISFTKNFLDIKNENTNIIYGNSNTFLYKIQAGFFNHSTIDDKNKKEYCVQIYNEIKWYSKLYSQFENFWSNGKSIICLKNEYINLKEYVENVDQAEKYKNKMNDLISKVNNYSFEGNENSKEKLIQLLQNKLMNPTKEVYEICEKNVNNFLKNFKEKLSGNQILFPFDKVDEFDEKNIYVICLNILKTYSSQYKKLSNIFEKSKNILSNIFQLDKEIEIISDILGKYALEKGDYINIYKNKCMGIIRSLILYNIIRIGKSRENIKLIFETFLNLSDIINDQTGGTGIKYFNEDILKFTKTITTDLEDYLIIPKFKPKDFFYLFLITYTEERENNQFSIISSKGFLFKNCQNKEIESILFQCLNKYDQQDSDNELKTGFQNYIEKIGRSLFEVILPEKCGDEFDKLSYMDLAKKLEEEKKIVKMEISEFKKNKKPYDNKELIKEIIDGIINCFTLATIYEQNFSDKILTYEDIDFFKNKNWNINLMSKYPGMTFWLAKYFPFYIDLMSKINNFGCFIAKSNQISFWYFQLRIISNIRTFEYNCYYHKNINIDNKSINIRQVFEDDKINNSIKNKIENFIKDNIIDLIKKKLPVNINWINLTLNDIPPEIKISNKIIRHFYDFFAILLADSNGYQKENKDEIIIEYIIKVLDLIFKNKIEEFLNKDINNNDELMKFIKDPQNVLIKKIKEINQKNLLESKINKNINNTLKYLEQIKILIPKIINNIDNIVKEKTIEYHKEYILERERKLKEEKLNIEKNFETAKRDINNCLSIIKNQELQDQKILEEKINEFDKLMNNKCYFTFTSKKVVIYYKLIINIILKRNTKYIIHIKNKNTHKNEKIEFDNTCKYIYLQESIFKEDDIQDFIIFLKDNYPRKFNIKDKIKIVQYSIYSFNSLMTFNQEVKEKMIMNAENSLRIFEPKITFNGHDFKREKLDNFINYIQNFDTKSLKYIDHYNDSLKNKLNHIIYTIDEFQKYLNLKTTNGKETDIELERNVRDLYNYFNKLKENLIENLNDVKNIISFNKKIEGDKIFIGNHDLKFVRHKEPKIQKLIYISNISYLKCPMISDNGEKITFSSKSFQMFLGSYIPSILFSPLIIKLLNIKGNKLKACIKNYNSNIVTLDEYENENTLKIYINISNIKSDKYYKEKIEFQLELNSENYKKILIPFNLSLNIVPLSILFESKNYKLKYDSEKNIFHLNTPIVYSNSKVKFSFNYRYKSKINNLNAVDFDYSLESLENNNSNKPIITSEYNKLTLKIPDYEEDKNNIINFILKIYFSSTFYINIKFNSKIYGILIIKKNLQLMIFKFI